MPTQWTLVKPGAIDTLVMKRVGKPLRRKPDDPGVVARRDFLDETRDECLRGNQDVHALGLLGASAAIGAGMMAPRR